ncbi:MAG TPA: tetratricopeptide repeat protein [Verrucomicrobiae bacterium]|nr:tetratricopeptide repeat protein [Verrucomicrobiae bacterium]
MQTTKKKGPQEQRARALFTPGWQRLFRVLDSARLRTRAQCLLFLQTLFVVLLLGCGPPGPRAVLEGKQALDRGDIPHAIEELRDATQLLPTNALAFSYLGLALQQAGQQAEAEAAYQRALALDHDLTEVHFNLGCLFLSESNKFDQAKSELINYTLRRPNSAEGWLRLGEAQLRSREITAAEKSFGEALRLSPQSAEAMTYLGLARYQRRRANEAAQFFTKALKQQPDYGPALLNLAIVAQQDLNDPRLALEKYRQYLALKPVPENAPNISAIVRELELELNPPAREPVTNATAATTLTHTNVVKSAELAHNAASLKPSQTNASPKTQGSQKLDPSTNVAKVSSPTNAPKTVSSIPTNTTQPLPVEVVKLEAEPVIKPAQDNFGSVTPVPAKQPERPGEYSSSSLSASEQRAQKKGFFQRINPMNLFGRDSKTQSFTTISPAATQSGEQAIPGRNATSSAVEVRGFPRYDYRSPEKPLPGDRNAAETAFASGVQEQQAGHLSQAIQAYRRAAQLDPAFFDAHYNLGLAATDNGNLPLALAAYETALAIRPESLDARYNFGLVLKQAGYVLDAATQFERVLAKYPNEGRAHLALGNLYAQQLQDPAKARQHYLAVLALAPQSPQAGAIRYWLLDHPK